MTIDPRCPHGAVRVLRAELSADVDRYLNKSPFASRTSWKSRLSGFLTPDVMGVAFYRVSHLFWARGWRSLGRFISRLNFLLHKTDIAPQSCIGPGLRLPHPVGVSFCGRAGRGLTLFALAIVSGRGGSPDADLPEAPDLGDDVLVGGNAAITGAIRVGSNVKVAYTVVMDCPVPSHAMVVSRNLLGHIRPRNP